MTRNVAILFAGLAVCTFMPTGPAAAQTFTTLYSFEASKTNASGSFTNRNGGGSYAGLTVGVDGNTRYGTTSLGGSWGAGTIFAVNTGGTGFKTLHEFNNADGAKPWAGLILSSNRLYGTTYLGGTSSNGTVFAINADGSGFRVLHSFAHADETTEINADGAYPNSGLILSGSALYGTASRGGSAGWGTVFALNIDGTGFATVHSFTGGEDGAIPVAALASSGDILYGTTSGGGLGSNGTVFALKMGGTGLVVLHTFSPTRYRVPSFCDSDSQCPPGYQCSGSHICSCTGFCGGGW